MLEMTPPLVEALAKEDITGFMRAAEAQMAGETFVRHAAVLAAAGRTTASEVMRISHSED
jgi:MSHA biogenesis protein MshE